MNREDTIIAIKKLVVHWEKVSMNYARNEYGHNECDGESLCDEFVTDLEDLLEKIEED